ncbi:MAG: alpha/beta hydrolase [Hyphomonadaceae bacterium]
MRAAAFTLFALLAAVLLGVVGFMWWSQRAMMYFPHAAIEAPSDDDVHAVSIETEDGETLIGWWLAPEEGQPVFLYFFGNAGMPEGEGRRIREIERRGAGYLNVVYRGYSGSTGEPSEAGFHADARGGYDWLIAQGVAPRDIVINGFSLGSGVAVRLAAEREARALILEAPYTAAVDVAGRRYPWAPVSVLMRDQFLSREFIGGVNMPVLIVHGTDDGVIPFDMGEQLFARAREPKQFVRIEGGEHGTLIEDGLFDHVWPFLEAHPPR